MKDGMIWEYRAVFTQTDVAGGTINVSVTFPEHCILLGCSIGKDDYAANRTLGVYRYRGAVMLETFFYSAVIDNMLSQIPVVDNSAWASSDYPYHHRINFSIDDILYIQAASLAQTETVTISLKMIIKTQKPVVTVGGGGTITTSTTYNKVI